MLVSSVASCVTNSCKTPNKVTDWAHHLGSSSRIGLITIVVVTLFGVGWGEACKWVSSCFVAVDAPLSNHSLTPHPKQGHQAWLDNLKWCAQSVVTDLWPLGLGYCWGLGIWSSRASPWVPINSLLRPIAVWLQFRRGLFDLPVWGVGSHGWTHSKARPWVPISSPFGTCGLLPLLSYLAGSKSVSVQYRYYDKYCSRSYHLCQVAKIMGSQNCQVKMHS